MAVEAIDKRWLEDALDNPEKLHDISVHDRTLAGISYECADYIKELLRLNDSELASLMGISQKTLDRRKGQERLESSESERILRAFRAFTKVLQVFRSEEKARSWLTREQIQLGERKPVDLLQTDTGVEQVMRAIGRMQHSVPV